MKLPPFFSRKNEGGKRKGKKEKKTEKKKEEKERFRGITLERRRQSPMARARG
jgi:hypothetical protein